MTEGESRGSHAAIIWGALILFVGVVFLLQVTGVLEWRIWGTLWKFWPVPIVLIGLSILLARRSPWIMAASTLVILGICLWISILNYVGNLAHDSIHIEQTFTYPVADVERADARIESDTGIIAIADLFWQDDNQLLLEFHDGRADERSPQGRYRTMDAEFIQNNRTVSVNVKSVYGKSWDDWLVRWGLYFNQYIPLSLDLRGDGSRVNLALEDLDIEKLYLEMDACSGLLTLPSSAGQTIIDIDMDVSNLEITVPKGVAVKIKADINIGLFSIDSERFLRQGEYFVSPDYENAANRIELNILCDVSRLVIK
jgi:hypothetical protein